MEFKPETMESSLDEHKSIELIRGMINNGRRNFSEGSVFYLVWGWAVLIAGLGQYALLNVADYKYHWAVWPVAMTVAGVASAVIGARQGKKQKFVTFTDTAMKYLWGGFVIFLFLLLFISPQIGWGPSYVLIVGLYGFGTFVSGGILQFRPLIIGGLLSIGLAITGVFVPLITESFSNVLLLLCLSIVVSYLIPGYMLRAKFNTNAA